MPSSETTTLHHSRVLRLTLLLSQDMEKITF